MLNTIATHRLCWAALWLPLVTGCAAFHPIKGLPARYMPDEFRGPSRSGKETIDLSLLRQSPPATHLVDTGDLLSIYIEGVLGRREEQPPVFFPQNSNLPPSVGYPIPVRDDGTISLPLVGSISVRGLSLRLVEETIRKAYTVDNQFLQNGRDRIFVALQQPRSYQILVIRQESGSQLSFGSDGTLNLGDLKQGTGKAVNLPVYKNDVLNALAETGGLPGLDAENAIYIIRGQNRPTQGLTPSPTYAPAGLPPAAAHKSDYIIRGQSPTGPAFNPQADYRSAGAMNQNRFAPQMAQPPSPPASVMPTATPAMAPVVQYQPTDYQAVQYQVEQSQPYQTPYQPAYQPYGATPPMMQAPQPVMPQPTLSPQMSASMLPPTPQPIMPVPEVGMQPYSPQPMMSPALPPQPYMSPTPVPVENYGTSQWTTPQQDWSPSAPVAPSTIGDWPVNFGSSLDNRHVIRIPIRLGPGEHADVRESDIILCDGDIVFIESRETEVFYTGGLLGGGQYTLPRDYDLDVLGAIAIAQGNSGGNGGSRATQSAGGQSALNADVSISASQLIVLRPLPDGNQLTIQVDLYEAIRNPNERITVQPGDYLILQYTRGEAFLAFVERHLLEGALFGVAASNLNGGGN